MKNYFRQKREIMGDYNRKPLNEPSKVYLVAKENKPLAFFVTLWLGIAIGALLVLWMLVETGGIIIYIVPSL